MSHVGLIFKKCVLSDLLQNMLEQGPAGPFIKSFLGSDFAFLRTQQGFHSSVVGFHNSAHARLRN
jgi:hypothetical protein